MKKLIIFISGLAITAWGLYISAKPVYIRLTGKTGTGIVTALHGGTRVGQHTGSSFLKSGKQPSVSFLPDGQQDSIRFLAAGGGLFANNYTAGERVTIVYDAKDVSRHAVFSFTEICSGIFAVFLGIILLLVILKPVKK